MESIFIKKRLQQWCLPMNIAKFQRTTFFNRTLLMAVSELKSNVSNVNLNKSKKKLFLHFDNSHTNQINTTKKMIFIYIVNINNKNLQKIDEKKHCFKGL